MVLPAHLCVPMCPRPQLGLCSRLLTQLFALINPQLLLSHIEVPHRDLRPSEKVLMFSPEEDQQNLLWAECLPLSFWWQNS